MGYFLTTSVFLGPYSQAAIPDFIASTEFVFGHNLDFLLSTKMQIRYLAAFSIWIGMDKSGVEGRREGKFNRSILSTGLSQRGGDEEREVTCQNLSEDSKAGLSKKAFS